jgi:ABC-type enterochelin transport system substrate-binding protein
MNTLAIVGSRTFNDYDTLSKITTKLVAHFNITKIVSGGAAGADTLASKYAKEHSIELVEFIPDWQLHGKSAGFKRNLDIVNNANVVIAFWDGSSKGTKHSIDISTTQQKTTIVVNYVTNNITVTP